MANPQATGAGKPDYAPPPIDGDFYRIAAVLNDEERALLQRVRDFTEGAVAPVIEEYWGRDEFPFAIIPIKSEPSTAAFTCPRPPNRLTPPITAAAIASVTRGMARQAAVGC